MSSGEAIGEVEYWYMYPISLRNSLEHAEKEFRILMGYMYQYSTSTIASPLHIFLHSLLPQQHIVLEGLFYSPQLRSQ